MSIFDLARHPPRWLRALLAVLALALCLDVVALASHQHTDGLTISSHSVPCDYCAAFHGAAAGPAQSTVHLTPPAAVAAPAFIALFQTASRPETSAQPRAPPAR